MTLVNRPAEIAAFLDQCGWGDAAMQGFDGDFSPRRYARLTRGDGTTAILMDADADQKTAQFVAVDGILRRCGIDAPEIFAALPESGLVLMQDFGRRNIGAQIDAGAEARPYFMRAASLLARLHRGFAGAGEVDLPLFDSDLLTAQAELFLDKYIPFAKEREASEEERRDFHAAWLAVLRPLDAMPRSLLLRDFMPDNLMDLTGGKLGVLDFQDAGIGPVAYDLASLCEEVRRDGGFALLPEVIAAYLEQADCGLSPADLMRACMILSAQRHTRILGIIAGHAMKTRRQDKLAFLPRVQRHLTSILAQPYLLPVREWMERNDVL